MTALGQSRRSRAAPDESGPPPITDIRRQRLTFIGLDLTVCVRALAEQPSGVEPNAKNRLESPDSDFAAWTALKEAYRLDATDRYIFDDCYPVPHRAVSFAKMGRFVDARLAASCSQFSSSNNPVRFGPFPSRYRCRFRLMPLQCLHHRDMRHHRITAMLADKHQHFGSRLPNGPSSKRVGS